MKYIPTTFLRLAPVLALALGSLLWAAGSPVLAQQAVQPCSPVTSTYGQNCTPWTATYPGPVALYGAAAGGTSVLHALSLASNNTTSLKASQGNLYAIAALNTNAATAYLKFSNTAAAPTCGTTAVAMTVPLVQNIPVNIPLGAGVAFPLGIGFCIVGGIADTDNSNATTGIVVNLIYQ